MIVDFLKDLAARHERLKKRIHSFRIPLSPTGQKIMGFVYFSIPVISGYWVMNYTNELAAKNFKLQQETMKPSEETIQRKAALQSMLDKAKKTS
mmetsp:Transcript_33949/g.34591  ORF Transcript_33949/g.34591 Transcript_33949/m.34591 type:complete len:94 (-) Transcript_33949:199-480(-)